MGPWSDGGPDERGATIRAMKTTTLALVLLLCAAVAVAADYEVPQDRQAKEILASTILKGPNYRIADLVVLDGYSQRWTVTSDYGAFDVEGNAALRKLLNEIRAIGELKKLKNSEAFAKGLGGAVKAPFGLAKSLITHPVDTVTGVPKGAYQLMEDVGTTVTNTKDPSEDSKVAQALKMSSFKRDIAAQLNVDPYSSNTILQKELNSVAWAAAAGDWAFSVAMLPAGAGGSIVANVRLTNSIKNVLQQEPPARLRIINDEKLKTMGIPEDLRKRYLDHRAYTPRHDTIMTQNLEGLTGVAGRDAFLTLALRAEDEADAELYTAMVQVLRGYHENVARLTEIRAFKRFTVAQSSAGPAVIALPVDRLIWTQRVEEASQQLKTGYQAPGFNGRFDMWVTGTLSPRARQALEPLGFTITERVNTRVEVID